MRFFSFAYIKSMVSKGQNHFKSFLKNIKIAQLDN